MQISKEAAVKAKEAVQRLVDASLDVDDTDAKYVSAIAADRDFLTDFLDSVESYAAEHIG